MKSLTRTVFLLNLIGCLLIFFPETSFAGVNIPWSTTYNCGEWSQGGESPSCDGLRGYGNWTCSGNREHITSAANNPNGGGGKGQRHWEGDGTNRNSGSLAIEFNSLQPELWVRWYMRYEKGFKWSPLIYDKWLYFNPGEARAVVPEWHGENTNIWVNTSGNHRSSAANGWFAVMNGPTSDGRWHYYEIHLKMDTNGKNGVAEMWIDGNIKLSYGNVNFGTAGGWTYIVIGENQRSPNNGRCMFVDFDDIKISNQGYIGPLGSGGGGKAAENTDDGGGGGCFIATAAFGSELEKHVQILTEFRDKILLTNSGGKKFVQYYYRVSPPIAAYLKQHEGTRSLVRFILIPVTGAAYLLLRINPAFLLAALILAISTLIYTRHSSKHSHR